MSDRAPVRILRVITRLNIGGPAIHAILLTRDLNDGLEFCSTLVTGLPSRHEGDMVDLAHQSGVQPRLLPQLGREISPLDDLKALAAMVKLVREVKPDVVHTHMAKAGTVGRLAAMLCGVPLIVHTYHGHVFHSYFGPLKTKVFVTIEKALALRTHRIVTVGDSQRREIASYGVAPLDKIEPIRLGLELTPFLEAESHVGELRGELGLPTEKLVGIVARLVPIKAHEDFLSAAVAVRASAPSAVFLVIGDGQRRAELEALTQQLGLTRAVRFLGWRRDLPRVYADLDVVALSSHNEGSPVSLIEALAAARPVVATAVGGVPEVVVDGETGLTVASAQPANLADAIVRLLHDPALAARLGAAGRGHVYPRYDSSRLVDDMRKLYLRELNARGRPVSSVGATGW